MSEKFVVSTMAADVEYVVYKHTADGKELRNTPLRSVRIKGGQGVMMRKTLVTPENGVVTPVSAEEADILKNHPVFLKHEKRGFVRLVDYESERKTAQLVNSEMEKEDDSAQLTADDFATDAARLKGENGDDLKIGGKKVSAGSKRSRKRK